MAEGVTYADLRFAKSLPQGQRLPPPGQDVQEDASDGELTYENCPAAAAAATRPRDPTPASPDAPSQAPGPARLRIWSRVPLALLAACLFLLAACLGLGLSYRQVSQQLEGASQRHGAEIGALAERMGILEENLTHYLGQLSRARAELSSTRLALRQSWEAGNSTQQQLEKQLEQAKSRLIILQQEKDKASRELDEARSCRQKGCCPPGWTLFRWQCWWVSREKRPWEGSRQACQRQEAQLLVLKPWDAGTIWEATEITGRLRSEEFWIGLNATWTYKHGWSWFWVDSTRYTGTDTLPSLDHYKEYAACITLKQRQLSGETCARTHRYICEKTASPSGPGWSA